MVVRVKIEKKRGNGLYLGPTTMQFINSGCTLMNLAISERPDGGWPLGRIVNIVGDKAVGKTLLAEEAMANFLKQYPEGKVYYRESEAAFDISYAKALGLNTSKVDFGPDGEDSNWSTVEDIFEDLDRVLTATEKSVQAKDKKNKKQPDNKPQPSLYIIDSLDALSSASELDRDIREGSYNLGKQKMLGELFRTLVRRIRRANMCLIFISQTRDRIGVMIRGKQYTRAGGKALDFYASLVIYLSEIGKLTKTIGGIKRVTGIRVKAKCEKNKIVTPFAVCVFTIRFRYGIDDELSSFDYLEEIKKLKEAGFDEVPKELSAVDAAVLRTNVARIWCEIEAGFSPAKGKYA